MLTSLRNKLLIAHSCTGLIYTAELLSFCVAAYISISQAFSGRTPVVMVYIRLSSGPNDTVVTM